MSGFSLRCLRQPGSPSPTFSIAGRRCGRQATWPRNWKVGRAPRERTSSQAASPTPTGSPFLEGETITVAGAALLQRIASAVTRAGGNIQSSQVELQGPQANDNYVGLVVSCEVEQAAVQALLYDIESGMPFLFIEQLTLQTPQGGMAADSGRMRVLLSVSGQWQGRR